MSGYNPYGSNPQNPPNPNYPQMYPGAPGQQGAMGYPAPGQPYQQPGQPYQQPGQPYQQPGQQYQQPQPGFWPGPGQPATGAPPSAMSYPGAPTAPGQPPAYGYPGYAQPPTMQQQYQSVIEWIPRNVNDAHTLSDRAVVGGYEGHDGSPLWVIRARYEGDLIPGKFAVKHRSAYVPWGGKENAVQTIEVCCARPDRVRWQESRDGICPPNAVVGGNTSAGEPLYVGRAREQGSLTPGKIHPSHNAMYISFAGREVAHKVYEVLCTV